VCVCAVLPTEVFADGYEYPLAAVRAKNGGLLVVDRKLPGVWESKDGKLSHYFEGSKKFRTPLNAARCAAFDRDGNLLVGDTSTREVYRFNEAGKPVPLTNGGIGMPMAIAVAADGTIFVADIELHRIFKVPHEGGQPEVFVAISAPRGLAFDADGNLIVVSTTENQLLKVDAKGEVTTILAGRPFSLPHNVAIGPDGTSYITDGYGKCVWKVTAGGKPVKLVEGEPLVNPVGIALDGDKLLVTDPRANAVFEIDFAGKLKLLEPGNR
jgi:sugar lactone lactonase YvrE